MTKPRYGALDLRSAHPDAINFVRLAPADDIQSVALSAFAYRDLGARSVLVLDDNQGRPIADAFEADFVKLGGKVIRRTLNPGAAPATVLAPLQDPSGPTVVYFVGDAAAAVNVRRAMAEGGWLGIPFLSWDALLTNSGVSEPGSGPGPYVEGTTAAIADGTYAAHASVPDHKFSFADAYRARFGDVPDEYAAAGYACVEIIAAALRGISSLGPEAAQVRELVREYAVNPQHHFETVIGDVGFDTNGDLLQQFVPFYRFDASAAGGAGDWVVFKKQDFGPAP